MRFSNIHTLFNLVFPSDRYSTKADRVLLNLLHRYTEPKRYHHTLRHIEYMAEHYLALGQELREDEALAILFHDTVYCGRHDEEASAFLLAKEAMYYGHPNKNAVESGMALTLTTKHDGKRPTSLVSDLDLLILAECPVLYRQYAINIRLEWLNYSEEAYTSGRMDFLEKMLRRGTIFGGHLEKANSKYNNLDDRAIMNMTEEYEFLKSGRSIICWK